jgi:hypothetical protein
VFIFEKTPGGAFPAVFAKDWDKFKTGIAKQDAEQRQNGEKKPDEGKVLFIVILCNPTYQVISYHISYLHFGSRIPPIREVISYNI